MLRIFGILVNNAEPDALRRYFSKTWCVAKMCLIWYVSEVHPDPRVEREMFGIGFSVPNLHYIPGV